MLKYLIFIAVFAVSLPFWLPTALGGDTSYHFVLSDSMKGTLDPGAFVVVRRDDSYEIGDAVSYYLDEGDGQRITILHRIIAKTPDGKFILKGDAVESTEVVEPESIRGRMVFAVPVLGFLPGAFRQAPILLGGMLLVIFFIAGGSKLGRSKKEQEADNPAKKEQEAAKPAKKENMFILATLVVLATIPFASLAMGDMLPLFTGSLFGDLLSKIPLVAFLLGIVAVTRLGEVVWVSGPKGSGAASVVEINYIAAMGMALTVLPFADVMDSARSVLTL